jgi:ankyrin repeat protein
VSRAEVARAGRRALLALAAVALAGRAGGQTAEERKEFFDALEANEPVAVRKLLVRGVSSNLVDPERGPAIVFAAQARGFQALRVLLDSRLTDIDARNSRGETALMYAALHGELDVARLLLRRGAQVNMSGWTPLHYAAIGGRTEMITLLLEHHAYIDSPSANGTTPLMMAARDGQFRIARLLVEQGADPSLRNEAGLGAPEYLLRRGDEAEARWMAERATEFLRRYGTREAPVRAERPDETRR